MADLHITVKPRKAHIQVHADHLVDGGPPVPATVQIADADNEYDSGYSYACMATLELRGEHPSVRFAEEDS